MNSLKRKIDKIINDVEGCGINFKKIKWGSFSNQFKNRKNKRLRNLEEFANEIIRHPNEYKKRTLKRANFYKHVIHGGMLRIRKNDEGENELYIDEDEMTPAEALDNLRLSLLNTPVEFSSEHPLNMKRHAFSFEKPEEEKPFELKKNIDKDLEIYMSRLSPEEKEKIFKDVVDEISNETTNEMMREIIDEEIEKKIKLKEYFDAIKEYSKEYPKEYPKGYPKYSKLIPENIFRKEGEDGIYGYKGLLNEENAVLKKREKIIGLEKEVKSEKEKYDKEFKESIKELSEINDKNKYDYLDNLEKQFIENQKRINDTQQKLTENIITTNEKEEKEKIMKIKLDKRTEEQKKIVEKINDKKKNTTTLTNKLEDLVSKEEELNHLMHGKLPAIFNKKTENIRNKMVKKDEKFLNDLEEIEVVEQKEEEDYKKKIDNYINTLESAKIRAEKIANPETIEKEKQTSVQDIKVVKKYIKKFQKYMSNNFVSENSKINDRLEIINEKTFNFVKPDGDLIDDDEEITEEDTNFLKITNNKKLAMKYIDQVKRENGLTEKYKTEEQIKNLIEKSGQAFELSCCGNQNMEDDDAIGPWIEVERDGKSHPEETNMIFSEFFIDKCHEETMIEMKTHFPNFKASSQGGQAPQDNFDALNSIANEMKDYRSGVNYNTSIRTANEYLKQQVLMDLRQEFHDLLDSKENKEEFNRLELLLSSKEEFEKYFYRNYKYYGIEIQVAKFEPIRLSNTNSKNTIKKIENCMGLFHPKCISHFQNGRIVYYQYQRSHVSSPENDLYNEIMTRKINEKLGLDGTYENGLTFLITVAFKDCIGQYNYSLDNCIDNDNVSGAYDLTPDRKGRAYKNYLIPIEKFKIIR